MKLSWQKQDDPEREGATVYTASDAADVDFTVEENGRGEWSGVGMMGGAVVYLKTGGLSAEAAQQAIEAWLDA